MSTRFVEDTALLTGRSLRHVLRSPDTIITTTVMPIAFMLLFVYVLGGAIETGTVSYVTYLLPGILVITIASGISYTAFRLFLDLQSGIFERFQSMPIARSAVLWAHVLTSLVATLLDALEQWAAQAGVPMPRPRERLLQFEGLADFLHILDWACGLAATRGLHGFRGVVVRQRRQGVLLVGRAVPARHQARHPRERQPRQQGGHDRGPDRLVPCRLAAVEGHHHAADDCRHLVRHEFRAHAGIAV